MKTGCTSKRSIAMALSWEIFSNLICLVFAIAVFGNVAGCILFTVICYFLKLILFYFHERLWHQIDWGKKP